MSRSQCLHHQAPCLQGARSASGYSQKTATFCAAAGPSDIRACEMPECYYANANKEVEGNLQLILSRRAAACSSAVAKIRVRLIFF